MCFRQCVMSLLLLRYQGLFDTYSFTYWIVQIWLSCFWALKQLTQIQKWPYNQFKGIQNTIKTQSWTFKSWSGRRIYDILNKIITQNIEFSPQNFLLNIIPSEINKENKHLIINIFPWGKEDTDYTSRGNLQVPALELFVRKESKITKRDRGREKEKQEMRGGGGAFQ